MFAPVLVMTRLPFFEAEAGDVLEVLGNARVVEQQLRVPDLERLAGAEEQCELADLALAAHHRRQEDAAGAVVGHFLGGGEGHEVALLIFELRVGAGLFLLEQALELGMLQRRVGGVVGAEAGKASCLARTMVRASPRRSMTPRRNAGMDTRPFASTAFSALP